jgi:hypothetical protein
MKWVAENIRKFPEKKEIYQNHGKLMENIASVPQSQRK